MKKYRLTQKGKKFFGGMLAVGFVGVIGLGNLNNNHDEVVYIDEFETVYASDLENEANEFKADQKDLTTLESVEIDNPASEFEITHVYEDGCLDVIEPVDGMTKFYCEAEFK